MSRSVTTPIKSFIPQRNGNRSPSSEHRGILKHRSDSSTRSASVKILENLPPVPDPDWSLYNEDDYIGIIDALYIHSVYTSDINKFSSNPRDSIHYDTSNPCAMCGNTGHNFEKCELLNNTTS